MELAATVAAERDDDEGRRCEPGCFRVVGDELREGDDDVVHEPRVRAHEVFARRTVRVALLEAVEALGEGAAEKVQPPAAPVLGARCPGLGAPGPTIDLGRHDDAERTSAWRLMSMRTQS